MKKHPPGFAGGVFLYAVAEELCGCGREVL